MAVSDAAERMGAGATAATSGYVPPTIDRDSIPWLTELPTGDTFYNQWLNWARSTKPGFTQGEQQYGKKWLQLAWWSATQGVTDENVVRGWMLEGQMIPPSVGSGGGGGVPKAQQYAAAEAAIRNQAATLGYTTMAETEIKSLARTVVDQNWSGDQLTDKLVNDATKNYDALTGGTIRGAVDQIKAGAASQLIAISDATARQWAKRMASGELDTDGLRNMLQTQATARYGWAADVIQSGMTMSDFLAPSRDRLANELEMNSEEVSLLDPKIMDMMTVVDEKGQRRVANDYEIVRNARKDERWKSTSNARTTLSSAAMMLRRYVEGN